MEYNTEAGPTKYLVGTEQGIVLQVAFTHTFSYLDYLPPGQPQKPETK